MITLKNVDFIICGQAYWTKKSKGNSFCRERHYTGDVENAKLMRKRPEKKDIYLEMKKKYEELINGKRN